jgi:hypothetical protein
MFKIAKERFGMKFAFSGTVTIDEMKQWSEQALKALPGQPKDFGVLVDNRELRPGGIQPEALKLLMDTQASYKKAGMARSCVILQSAAVTMQLERTARESGIGAFERYINASIEPKWEAKAIAWLEKKIDPNF